MTLVGLVGCFVFNGPLRLYFSLYQAISQRWRKNREKIDEREISKQPPPAPAARASRTPRHWKLIQHLRTTGLPHVHDIASVVINIVFPLSANSNTFLKIREHTYNSVIDRNRNFLIIVLKTNLILTCVCLFVYMYLHFSVLFYRLGATLTTLRDRVVEGEEGDDDKRALEILVRKIPEDQQVNILLCCCM